MHTLRSISRRLVLAATLLALPALTATAPVVAAGLHGGHEAPAFSVELPNVPGKRLTAIVVHYAPGGASPAHHHAGSVFAYVLTGVIRSQNSATGPARDYRAGESFFEPPGSHHLVSENASKTEPASLLAIFVADDGAVLTAPDK
ncbi:MAG TPA: cupin domain-containing protein [Methylovirgula sp.]